MLASQLFVLLIFRKPVCFVVPSAYPMCRSCFYMVASARSNQIAPMSMAA